MKKTLLLFILIAVNTCFAQNGPITFETGGYGTLWTWTVQGYPPKSPPYAGNVDPKTFQAFGVGYIELPGQIKIEARLTESDPAKLKIGMEMEMVLVPLNTDEAGNEVVTFAFAPVA